MKNIYGVSSLALALALSACSKPNSVDHASAPDMCISGGTIYSGIGDTSTHNTILVKNGKITEISEPNSCNKHSSKSTQTIDLDGAFLYPGFVDSHAHLLGIGLREMTLNLEGIPSIKALKQKLAEEVKNTPKGDTVYGRGWIETHWPENRFPTRQDLDEVSPNNPVLLQRSDGHAMVANSKALEAAGITKDTKPPFGGDILHAKDGKPTGMLIDHAMGPCPRPDAHPNPCPQTGRLYQGVRNLRRLWLDGYPIHVGGRQ